MDVTLVDAATGERVSVPTAWLPNDATLHRVLPNGTEMEVRDLDPHMLRVDYAYQRPLQKKRVQEYARAWDEARAFALTVSRRGPADFVVIDGQHRLYAALEAGIETVPCLVLTGLTRPQEAALFTQLSIARVELSTQDRFRARREAGDPVCAFITQAVYEAGFSLDLEHRMSKEARQIQAVACLEHIYQRGLSLRPKFKTTAPITPDEGMAAIKRVLFTIHACWPGQKDAKQHDMLLGVHIFWAYYADSVSLERLVEKTRHTTATTLVRTAMAQRQTMGGSRPLWVAHALLEAVNRQMRNGRLKNLMPLPGTTADPEGLDA